MTTPLPPNPRVPGPEPLDSEPLSVHPPYITASGHDEDRGERYVALLTALGDELELGSYDVSILGWLADQGTAPVAVICSLLRRVHAAACREGNPHP